MRGGGTSEGAEPFAKSGGLISVDKFHERMRNRGQGGFTLIELLVVVAILAVLGGAVIIGVGALRGNAEEEVCKTDRETLETAVQAFIVSEGNPPASLAALQDPNGDGNQSDSLIKKNFDPSDFVLSGEDVTASTTGKYDTVAAACNA